MELIDYDDQTQRKSVLEARATHAASNEEISGQVKLAQDIYQQKTTVSSLQESEERYSTILSNIEDGYYEVDLAGNLTFFNDSLCKMLGYDADELQGMNYRQYTQDIDVPMVFKLYNSVYTSGRPSRGFGWARISKDGKLKFIETSVSNIADAHGLIIGFRGICRDISERKRAEEELQAAHEQMEAAFEELSATEEELRSQYQQLQKQEEDLRNSEQRLADIINFLPDPTMVINNAGEIIVWNQAAEAITGVKSIDILGKGNYEHALPFYGFRRPILIDLVLNPDKQIEKEYQFILRDKQSIMVEANLPVVNGKPRFFSGKAIPLYDTRGKLVGAIESMHDITDRKLAAEELQKAKEAAEQANMAKSHFLANMSHEIRTPMNGIMGMTDLTLMTNLTPEQRDYLSMVKSSSQVLLRVINDILDYSKIEAGYINLEKQSFNIRDTIHEVMVLFAISSQQKGLAMDSSIDDTIPQYIIGDSVRLRQVLSNLIGNAIKFTSSGGINIKLDYEYCNDHQIKLKFAITDTGIGIAEDNLDKLFKRFSQVDDSHKKPYGGSGLGLAISKSLVELMSGSMEVESQLGVGSNFYFTAVFDIDSVNKSLYTNYGAKHNCLPLALPQLKKVLIVEDDEVSIFLALKLLKQKGLLVTLARNGLEAVELFDHENFDLVLIDINIPYMDGYGATAVIRMNEKMTNKHTPIIAMTAYSLSGDRAKCLNAGMDDYIAKPIDINEMNAIIDKWLGKISDLDFTRENHPIFFEDAKSNLSKIDSSIRESGFGNSVIPTNEVSQQELNQILNTLEKQLIANRFNAGDTYTRLQAQTQGWRDDVMNNLGKAINNYDYDQSLEYLTELRLALTEWKER